MPFCPKCGENMDANAEFCYFCGAKNPKLVPQSQQSKASRQYATNQTPLAPVVQSSSVEQPASGKEQPEEKAHKAIDKKPEKNRKTLRLVLIGILAALLVAVGVLLVVMLATPEKEKDAASTGQTVPAGDNGVPVSQGRQEKAAPIYAVEASDGHYILLDDGTCIKIDAQDVRQAVMSPNRQTILVLLENGTVYATNREQLGKTELGKIEGTISASYDYESLDGAEILEENGKLYLIMPEGEKVFLDEAEHITTRQTTPSGSIAVWANFSEGSYLYSAGKTYELIQADGGIATASIVEASRDGKLAVVHASAMIENETQNKWYIVQEGRKPREISYTKQSLGLRTSVRNNGFGMRVLTENGFLDEVNADGISTLIFNDSYGQGEPRAVFMCSVADGELVSYENIYNCDTSNGTITYYDYSGDSVKLCCGKLRGLEITEKTVLADAAQWGKSGEDIDPMFSLISPDGKYIFYTVGRAGENNGKKITETVLYCYKLGEGQPQEVCSTLYAGYFWVSEEDGTVYMVDNGYYMSADNIAGIDEDFARTYMFPDLKLWRYGDAEPTLIQENIVSHPDETFAPIGQGFADRYDQVRTIGADGLVFPAITDWTDFENPVIRWLHYDGETVKLLLEMPN